MIDDESLVKTRTNTCLSYASAVPSYSVPRSTLKKSRHYFLTGIERLGRIIKNCCENT